MKTQGSLVACGDRLALDKPSIIVIEAEVSRPTVKTPSSWVPTQELERRGVRRSEHRVASQVLWVRGCGCVRRAEAACFDPQNMAALLGAGSGGGGGGIAPPKEFTFAQLSRATNDFHPDSKIGEGATGHVFKGELRVGLPSTQGMNVC